MTSKINSNKVMNQKSNNKASVLVSTVGAWSDSVGSNTMSELFQEFDKDNLACLYIRADISDSAACRRYFHIYEGRVMKSIFKRGVMTGEEYYLGVDNITSSDAEEEKARYDSYRRKNNWFYLFAREFVWVFGHWRSKELDAFLKDFNPEIVFFSIESYIHFNRINEYIIKKCHPKVVLGYMWDDNFTYKQQSGSFGFYLHRWWLRHGVKRLVRKCNTVFAICPKMKRELNAEFGIDSVLLTKPIYHFNDLKVYENHQPIKLLYTGKLIYGRDATVAEIVDAIKEVNKDRQKVLLQIYTGTELPERLRERICVPGCCEIKGFVPQSEVLKIQKEADVLLYVESLSNENLTARLSFSTKMTDYLASGACIWAVGNGDLAPLEYLKEEDAGLVSSDKESIRLVLQQIIVSPEVLGEYAQKAQECGRRNHDAEHIRKVFYQTFLNHEE